VLTAPRSCLKNFRELNLRPNAVEAGHSLQEFVGEELSSRVFRVPHVDVPRVVLLLVECEELVAQVGQAFELSLDILRDLANSRLVEAVGVERHEYSNH
jgi:hypothetical protein